MSHELFNESERELIDAAKLVLSDGLTRLKTREGLFPTNHSRTRADRAACTVARQTLVDHLVSTYGPLRREVAAVALIDAQGRLIAVKEFPQGKHTHCEVDPLILMGFIVDSGATTVVLAHNHPSGDNTPSKADETMTKEFASWLRFANIRLLDHLVITCDGASSIIGEL